MARISALKLEEAPVASRVELERQIAAHGRVTNMKSTLAHSPVALAALMQWYSLYEVVVPALGGAEDDSVRTCHFESDQLPDLLDLLSPLAWRAGRDPDELVLDERDRAIVDFGRQLAIDSNRVSDALHARLAACSRRSN